MSAQKPLNPWNYKPWWCQPWSIVLTGTAVIAGSWAITRLLWITVIISVPIILWWTYFLWLWPRLIRLYSLQSSEQPSVPDSPLTPTDP